jgi:adenylate cyclase
MSGMKITNNAVHSIRRQLKVKDRRNVFLASISIGFCSAILLAIFDLGYQIPILDRAINGGIMGTLISGFYLLFTIEVLRKPKMRKLRYSYLVCLSFFALVMITVLVHSVVGYFRFREHAISSHSFIVSILISMGFAFLVTLVETVRQFSGKSVIKNVLLGRYYHAKQEDLIFLFIDLRSSTSLAEQLGSEKFFNFLNEFHSTVEDCVRGCSGTIYKYLGDGQIVIWPGDKADLAFEMNLILQKEIQILQSRILKLYGQPMVFTAGLHRGPVLIGEIGTEKREIGYWGNTINTAQRIQALCKENETTMMMSEDFYNSLSPQAYENASLEKITGVFLKGKSSAINLYKVH